MCAWVFTLTYEVRIGHTQSLIPAAPNKVIVSETPSCSLSSTADTPKRIFTHPTHSLPQCYYYHNTNHMFILSIFPRNVLVFFILICV